MRIVPVIAILILICILAAAGCTDTSPSTTATPATTIPPADDSATARTFQMIPQAPLNASETQDIYYLQESEKLSHDLNVKLYGLHSDVPVFLQIANVSAIFVTADNVILERYGLKNPEAATSGVFSNAALQNMYTSGVNNGLSSVVDALKSSANAEDMHIADLSAAIARTDNADLIFMYRQELAASRNSIRTLSQAISGYGQTYVPKYITPASYAAIISSPMESLPVQ